MNRDQIESDESPPNWPEHWGKLTDDELDIIEGRRELLVTKLQNKFGISREEADRRYQEFEESGFIKS